MYMEKIKEFAEIQSIILRLGLWSAVFLCIQGNKKNGRYFRKKCMYGPACIFALDLNYMYIENYYKLKLRINWRV